jgi:predicted MPP superfamily phosphohydrolase
MRKALLAAGLALAALAVGSGWGLRGSSAARAREGAAVSQGAFQDQTGIRVLRVAVTGGGGLVDLRYQVLDPLKAEVVHVRPPKLIDERSGQTIDALFMGHSHGGQAKAGYAYPLLFINEQGLLRRGGEVSVVIGGSRLEHIAVG